MQTLVSTLHRPPRQEGLEATLTIKIAFPPDLGDWITVNLQRGNPPAVLIDALVSRNFEPRVARGLVDAFVRAVAAGSPPPRHSVTLDLETTEYEYETPRIASGHVIQVAGHDIGVLQRLQRPLVVTLQNVMTEPECAQLIDMALPRLKPSTLVDPRSGINAVGDRISAGMFFRPNENPFIALLDERVCALMNCPIENGEGLQVVRYECGGQYPPHCDYLVPRNSASTQSIARSGQRISTLIVYLNDVPAGGETVFPLAGLAVSPRRGNGVYFEYANSRLQVDPKSLHAGAPVAQGEKWIVTKWMRSRPFISA